MFSHFVRKLIPTARPRLVRHGSHVWQLSPAGERLFGPAGVRLDDWLSGGAAEVVKTGTQRTVYRVELPGGAVFVKRVKPGTPRAWCREFLRPAKARLEFENALTLIARGVPVAEPLAWGARSSFLPGESLIVTRCLDAIPFDRYLESPLSPAERRRATVALAATLAKLHDAGVAHPDPHPGNLLVRPTAAGPKFAVLDLHAVRLGKPLSWADSRDNLVLLNRWFQLRSLRTDRLRFFRTYLKNRTTLAAGDARDLERRTLESNARFWAARMERYTRPNRQYKRLRGGFAVRDLADDFAARLAADPDAPFRDPANRKLKDSRTSTVVEVTVPGVGPAIYKRFNLKGRFAAAKNLFRASPALRSWLFGHNLLDRGLPTARPLLVLHRRRRGLPAEGYLLCEKVPDAVELPAAVAASDFRARRALADRIGRLVRTLHDRHVAHRDLKAPNVLVSAGDPVLIDLVGVVPGPAVDRRTRVANLTRLNASFVGSPHLTRTDRLRVLRAYLCWGLHGRRDWKDWWRSVAVGTAAKVARNERVGRVLA